MIIIKKEYRTLLGIVWPHYRPKLESLISNISKATHTYYSDIDPDVLVRVEFDFNIIQKKDVYWVLVHIKPEWFSCSERKIAKIMAIYTNLADNPQRDIRTNTIRCRYNLVKNQYK